jgi:nuclear factor 1
MFYSFFNSNPFLGLTTLQENHSPVHDHLNTVSSNLSNSLNTSSGIVSTVPFNSSYFALPGKYQESGDALSDFVNLVCQEAQHPGGGSSDEESNGDHRNSPSKTGHYFNQMTNMLPPPPPAPMARPVPIMRTVHIEPCSPEISVTSSPSSPCQPVNPSTPGDDASNKLDTNRIMVNNTEAANTENESRGSNQGLRSHSSTNQVMSQPHNDNPCRSAINPFTALARADHSFFHLQSPVPQVRDN